MARGNPVSTARPWRCPYRRGHQGRATVARRWPAVLILSVAVALAACSGGDDDFAVGRDTATVWQITNTPLSKDAEEEFELLFDIFDFPYRDPGLHGTGTAQIRSTDWIRLGFAAPQPEQRQRSAINFLDGAWSYRAEGVMPTISGASTRPAPRFPSATTRPCGGHANS